MVSIWGLELEPGRHRRRDASAVVHVVLRDGSDVVLEPDAALTRSMAQVAALIASNG